MGKLCEKEDPPATTGEETDEKPTGVAKRAGGYQKSLDMAKIVPMHPTTRLEIDRACAQGTPELTAGERCLLAYYVSHLSCKDQTVGKSCVWPGAINTSQALGIAVSSVRRQKASLEKKGLLIRKYDHRNRPLDEGAIDLRPFILSIPKRLQTITKRLERRRAEIAASRVAEEGSVTPACTADYRDEPETSPDAIVPQTITQVTTDKPQNGESNHSVSEGEFLEEEFKNEFGEKFVKRVPKFTTGNENLTEQQIIEACLKISPKLRNALVPDNQPLNPEQAAKRLIEALPVLFPNADITSIGHTLRWAIRRYDIRVFECLTVALEDPKVSDPERYFGWVTTTSKKVNLRFALERVRRKNPPPVEIDFPLNSLGQEIARHLARHIGGAKYNTWFARDKTRFRQQGDKLVIETISSFAADRMATHLGSALRVAAGAVGFKTYKVAVIKTFTERMPEASRLSNSAITVSADAMALPIEPGNYPDAVAE